MQSFLTARPTDGDSEASGVRGAGPTFRAKQWRVGEKQPGTERRRPPLTSALYMRMRPWFTLDQEGTALMFHSWLECSAKGPVFIWKREPTS